MRGFSPPAPNSEAIREALRCGRSGCPCVRERGHVHCPHHDPNRTDQTPSLSLNNEGGKILWKCFNGCGQPEVLAALKELGLLGNASSNGDRPTPPRKKGRISRWPICDTEGCHIATHVREDVPGGGKNLWWERPDGSKGLGGTPVVDLPLYGSEHLKDLPGGAAVIICEGEPKTQALIDAGFAAVGTVTGASSTPGDGALRPLVRLCPILWPDNDDPGRGHMGRIAAKLTKLDCKSVRVVDWQDAPPKGDAADAVAQGVDVAALISDAAVWKPGDVNLADLLDGVVAFIRRFVVLTEHQLLTLALWTAHTYALEAADCTPYLSVKSAEKQSGKTLLLEVLSLLVARPWFTGRVSSAVLVRKMARDCPTLLLDETDAMFKGDKEYRETLRGVLNSGYRRGGVTSLCVKVGGDYDLRDFPVFGAKAFAGIGKLPDTVQDRSIPIELRRKTSNEHVARFRLKDAKGEATPLRESLKQWGPLAVPTLEGARPEIPQELDDRATDVWEPLIAIADMASGRWPERAHEAALALSAGSAREDDSLGVTLLRSIRDIFEGQQVDRLPSAALVEALVKLEEAPWGDLWGKPLDTRRLARMLKPYGIRPKQLRLDPETTMKGYQAGGFKDSWARYISPGRETPETRETESVARLNLDGQNVSDVSLVSVPGDMGDGDDREVLDL